MSAQDLGESFISRVRADLLGWWQTGTETTEGVKIYREGLVDQTGVEPVTS